MIDIERLCLDAYRVATREPVTQHQEDLQTQLETLAVLANLFGLYDANDFLKRHHLNEE